MRGTRQADVTGNLGNSLRMLVPKAEAKLGSEYQLRPTSRISIPWVEGTAMQGGSS